MLSDLGQLEQRARHLYAPTMTSQSNGRTIHQCELVRDELAEAVFYFVADLCLLPHIFARWVRQWRKVPQVG